jgi:hypothetical protein
VLRLCGVKMSWNPVLILVLQRLMGRLLMIVERGGRHLLLWLRLRLLGLLRLMVTRHGGRDLGSSRGCGERWL